MIKPTKKAKSLIERLKAERRPDRATWFGLLPKDTAEKIIEIKSLMKSGEIKLSATHVANEIVEEFGQQHLGVKADTIRKFLAS